MKLHDKPKVGKIKEEAEEFYSKLIEFLLKKKLPFMIGGTYAFTEYTGIERPTKDLDIVTSEDIYPKILKELSEAGFNTKLHETEFNWMAKVSSERYFADIMFAERNGLQRVNTSWFNHAKQGTVLEHSVKLLPVEEMIRSKAYIQGRDRSDEPDIVHLILKQGKIIDWKLLLGKMDPHWEVLAAHLLMFLFVYPSERSEIPDWVLKQVMKKIEDRLSHPPTKDRITRGLLISKDYQIGVYKWGYKPIMELK